MEQPLFYQGQRVVACVVTPDNTWVLNTKSPQPIDGKSYYVSNPDVDREDGLVWITIAGMGEMRHFWQGQFIPYDSDHQLEEQIHEAMKDIRIEN